MAQLSRVSPEVQKFLFVVTIADDLARGHNSGQISNAYIRIVPIKSSNRELIRYNLTEYYPNVISMVHLEKFTANMMGTGNSILLETEIKIT